VSHEYKFYSSKMGVSVNILFSLLAVESLFFDFAGI